MKKISPSIAIILYFFAISQSFGFDSTFKRLSPDKEAKILRFMTAISMDKIGEQMFDNFIEPYKGMIATAPAEYWNGLKNILGCDTLNQKLTTIYIKYFDDKDIDELTKFFESKYGKKFIQLIRDFNNDSYEIAEEWFISAKDKIKDQLIKDGYLNIQK